MRTTLLLPFLLYGSSFLGLLFLTESMLNFEKLQQDYIPAPTAFIRQGLPFGLPYSPVVDSIIGDMGLPGFSGASFSNGGGDNVFDEEAAPPNACRERDSLALVAFYNAAHENGPWVNEWDLTQPMDTWWGIRLDENGCVTSFNTEPEGTPVINNFKGELPPEIGDLLDLDTLIISYGSFDTIPNAIGNLVDLDHFFLNGGVNFQNSKLPASVGNLSNLKVFQINNVKGLTGPIPPEIGNLLQLTHLRLRADFTGGIPPEIGNLANLERLGIFDNVNLGGSIPPELGNLANLLALYLWRNGLTGDIPTELGDLSNLQGLYLDRNELTGSIPVSLGNLSKLNYFDLSENQLSGNIPSELFAPDFTPVQFNLEKNNLSGVIPDEMGNLPSLRILDLSYNQLGGELPESLSAVRNSLQPFRQLTLNNNQFSGCFPLEYSVFCDVDSVNFSGNTFLPGGGDFEAFCTTAAGACAQTCRQRDSLALVTFYNATQENGPWKIGWDLTQPMDTWYGVGLDAGGCVGSLVLRPDSILGNNNIRGALPPEIGDLLDLDTLDIRGARFDTIPSAIGYLTDLEYLQFGGTFFNNSQVPASIGNLTNLTLLYFNATPGLTGPIPPEIGNLSNLVRLRLRADFTGGIPVEIANLDNLEELGVFENNNLGGTIPPELGSMPNLKGVFLWNNGLTGNIPSELGNLQNLRSLALYRNQLSGAIPSTLGKLKLNYMDLSDNQLSGNLPVGLFTQSLNPLTFQFQGNQLSGSIPEDIVNLTNLRVVDLSNNQFSGELPSALAELVSNNAFFRHLTLNNNQFSGCFPTQYTALCAVDSVNFSGNAGLPGGGDFAAFCVDGTGGCSTTCADALTIPQNVEPCGTASVVALLDNIPPSTTPPTGTCADTSYAGNSLWFKTIIPPTGNLLIRANAGTTIRAMIQSYDDCAGTSSSLDCRDLSQEPRAMLIDRDPSEAGQVLYFQVWDKNNTVVNSGPNAVVELSAYILPESLDDWVLCEVAEAAPDGSGEVTQGKRSPRQFIIQYDPNATAEEINQKRDILINEVGATLVDTCNCRSRPLELWQAADPVDLEEKIRGAKAKANVDTSDINYNYLIEDAYCVDSLKEFKVNNGSLASIPNLDISMNTTGRAVAVWDRGPSGDYAFQILDRSGKKIGPETNLSTIDGRANPKVAVHESGNFTIVWESTQSGCSNLIFERQFDFNGIPVSVPDTVAQCSASITLNSEADIAMDKNGAFVVVWSQQRTTSSSTEIMGQKYDANGEKAGIPFQINTNTNDLQSSPAIAMNDDGRFVVVWKSFIGILGTEYGIFGQLFDASGTPVGSEFRIDPPAGAALLVFDIDVAMDEAGRFAVVWDEVEADNNYDVVVQLFDENGGKIGGATELSAPGINNLYPSVSTTSGRGFFVAWTNSGSGGSYRDIYGQAIAPDGSIPGNPFLINSFTEGNQSLPEVISNGAQDYLVIWYSNGQDFGGPVVASQNDGSPGIFGQVLRDLPFDNLDYPIPFSGNSPCLDVLVPVSPEPAGDKYVPVNPQSAVRVAVLDAGIEQNHDFFEFALWQNSNPEEGCVMDDIIGYDFAQEDAVPDDSNGHGTSVNGVIAGGFPSDIQLELMNPKFYEVDRGTVFDAVCGIYYAIEEGADIINLSWGFESQEFPRILQEAIDLAEQRDILVVTSAGNDSKDNDGIKKYPANFDNPNIIAVTAYEVDPTNQTPKLSAYANYGNEKVLLAAPGYIETAASDNTIQPVAGTSIAAPRVARLAAILKGTYPILSALDIKDCILREATRSGSLENKVANNRLLDSEAEKNILNCAAQKALQLECSTESLLIEEILTTDVTYKTAAQIESDTRIEAGAEVIFSATDLIRLKAGFKVEPGASFLATMQGCSFTELLRRQPEETVAVKESGRGLETTEAESEAAPDESPEWRISPNPFTSTARIALKLPRGGHVRLTLHDLGGRMITVLQSAQLKSGWYETDLLGGNLPPGVYFLRLQTDKGVFTEKVIRQE